MLNLVLSSAGRGGRRQLHRRLRQRHSRSTHVGRRRHRRPRHSRILPRLPGKARFPLPELTARVDG